MSEYQRFLADNGEQLRYKYDLTPESIVMDVGGYQGEFAQNIFNKFGCFVCVFEPVFYKELFERFVDNDKIYIHDYGLSSKTGTRTISINADSTSFHRDFEQVKDVQMMDIVQFMQSEKQDIDLIKINIEGDEYDLLDRILDSQIANRFKNIQVQFHKFILECDKRREKIQKDLSETHELEWCYDFIWESWKRK